MLECIAFHVLAVIEPLNRKFLPGYLNVKNYITAFCNLMFQVFDEIEQCLEMYSYQVSPQEKKNIRRHIWIMGRHQKFDASAKLRHQNLGIRPHHPQINNVCAEILDDNCICYLFLIIKLAIIILQSYVTKPIKSSHKF